MKNRTHIEKSFRIAIVILILVSITLLSILLKAGRSLALGELLIGLPILIAGILGIVGFVQGLKGRKENLSFKKILALIVNSGVVILLVGLIAANVIDILTAFN
ncbi:hypothetical protein [Labilibacter marinus]|uniref:hypothetical protein n=1 Tax=Labilibacter marinus TaxID=1477105 RepID=UPI000834909B|nr:hypothetical protein [Labilibacter marinus]